MQYSVKLSMRRLASSFRGKKASPGADQSLTGVCTLKRTPPPIVKPVQPPAAPPPQPRALIP
eukprot:6207153-Pleurochrysis_carterae.AAC.2